MDAFEIGVVEGMEKIAATSVPKKLRRKVKAGLDEAGSSISSRYRLWGHAPRPAELAMSNPREARRHLSGFLRADKRAKRTPGVIGKVEEEMAGEARSAKRMLEQYMRAPKARPVP